MRITSKKQAPLNDECVLVKTLYEPNENDYDIPAVTREAEAFCGIFSVSWNEYYEAARQGLKPVCGIIINAVDDISPDHVRLNSRTYKVTRNYQRSDGYTELYLEDE